MGYRADLTATQVRSLLSYDPKTGEFLWRETRSYQALAGKPAGWFYNGYRWIVIDRVRYAAHRLAWLIMTGAWPVDQIDHRDMDRGNNRFANLRQASRAQNNANRRKVLPTQLKGVTRAGPLNKTNPWVAQIALNKQHFNLGYYPTEQAAHEAYCRAARKLFGEFARTE